MSRVLIVEDDPAIQHAYAFAFEHAGFQVDVASNAEHAMAVLANMPDVILLDMLMPGLSGLDFMRESNPKAKLPDLKIIALTNIESESIRKQASELGIDRYLVKVSFTPSDVIGIVNEMLGTAPAPAA